MFGNTFSLPNIALSFVLVALMRLAPLLSFSDRNSENDIDLEMGKRLLRNIVVKNKLKFENWNQNLSQIGN